MPVSLTIHTYLDIRFNNLLQGTYHMQPDCESLIAQVHQDASTSLLSSRSKSACKITVQMGRCAVNNQYGAENSSAILQDDRP